MYCSKSMKYIKMHWLHMSQRIQGLKLMFSSVSVGKRTSEQTEIKNQPICDEIKEIKLHRIEDAL